jgi:hypothetical protein
MADGVNSHFVEMRDRRQCAQSRALTDLP